MRVSYSYLKHQFNNPRAIFRAIARVVKHGQFTLGPELQRFEKRFAELHGTKYAIGVATGTDALILIMKGLDIGAGDEVITAPNSFIATAGAIAMASARPVFTDVDATYTLDPKLIAAAITNKTKAILPVHLTGYPADMEAILKIAKKHKLYVIEDAAQAVGARYKNKAVGSWGVAGAFSLHPLKNLNIWGDGGVVTTNSDELYKNILLWRNHGLKNRDECCFFAHNNRLDTIHAAIGDQLLTHIARVNSIRAKNAAFYDTQLAHLQPHVVLPPRSSQTQPAFHTYVIQVERRDALIAHLAKAGIETKIHYPIPIHRQEAARYLGYKKGDFPVTEAQTTKILSLPIHQYLTKQQLAYTVKMIHDFYGQKNKAPLA